jgi:hypothetical protein
MKGVEGGGVGGNFTIVRQNGNICEAVEDEPYSMGPLRHNC